jgi:isoleucyl-tRNA synthetase
MEKNGLRKKALSEIEKVAWIPKWGRDRIHGMVSNRPDWCISRQRAWGVPITILRCGNCEEFVTDPDILSGIVNLVEAHSADIWFRKRQRSFYRPAISAKNAGALLFRKRWIYWMSGSIQE